MLEVKLLLFLPTVLMYQGYMKRYKFSFKKKTISLIHTKKYRLAHLISSDKKGTRSKLLFWNALKIHL